MLANDVRSGVDGATAKARWLACRMEHENTALKGEDDIVRMIKAMGQQVGWMMHPMLCQCTRKRKYRVPRCMSWNRQAETCCILVVEQMMRRVWGEHGGVEKEKKRDEKFVPHGRNVLGPRREDKVAGS
jgi:hypothetical protein